MIGIRSRDGEGGAWLAGLIAGEARLREPLRAVAAIGLPEAWIGAGLLRNAAWDALSGFPPGRNPPGDIDVVWFDPGAGPAADAAAGRALRAAMPGLPWSVRNQARMAARNGDAPYADTRDAAAHWPETATAVLARWAGPRAGPRAGAGPGAGAGAGPGAGVEVAAPWGFADLLGRVVRPTPDFARLPAKRAIFAARCRAQRWRERWPGVRMAAG
ncbi:nucleotidyltransferase family protein [Roseicella frigidaeris]|uniref:Nucleotidyltransferase family protein n=1 Tax=Roseicella frigidaeris TaxID=2230885 RepID=A0A327LZ16_9PROT|nr:nucleotidyltransferase family protein [Roseicella frigidaeris]RAI55374.1 hypothetical protein DOO78_23720 [Roseicella frigidaeris]